MTSQAQELNIGILLTSHDVPKPISDFLKSLPSQIRATCFSLSGQLKKKDKTGPITDILNKIIFKLDSRYLRRTPYRDLLNHVAITAEPLRSYDDLKALNFDYLISFDGSPLPQEALSFTKKGAFLLQAGLGDNSADFYGFWEVFHRQVTTDFRIDHQGIDGKISSALAGSLLTQPSFLLNKAYIAQKALHYLKIYLEKLSEGTESSLNHLRSSDLSHPRDPSAFELCSYIFKRIFRTLQEKKTLRQGKEQQWNVAFKKAEWNPTILSQGISFPINSDQFFADPFVITKDNRHYCFVEEYDFKTSLGHISAFELTEKEALPLGVVFKEPFHLSFPYLFEYQNELYMCPETSGAREIRVYKCNEFPMRWTFVKAIMKDISAVDSMLFEQEGRWWMLTNIDSLQRNDHCTELLAFSADSPLSDKWTAHPSNPLMINPKKARNGGLLRKGRDLYRVSQVQGFGVYGAASCIHKILNISQSDYREETVARIAPDFFPNIFGTHHLHSDGAVTVYDFCRNVTIKK